MCLPVTEVVINKIKVRRLRNGKEIPQELSIGENSTLSLNLNYVFMCQNVARERKKKAGKNVRMNKIGNICTA